MVSVALHAGDAGFQAFEFYLLPATATTVSGGDLHPSLSLVLFAAQEVRMVGVTDLRTGPQL